ncbi:FecR family protein [Butyricimonas synergistica]|uniref:FecR family protein n=1 Tax=Butyricimonas synergistica TaxID=544644 RepID=UPI00036A8FAA|nr:FecR family protein [Butyricimonas synergistica]
MNKLTDHIVEQIIAFYLERLSEEERGELETWVNESTEHRDIFRKVLRVCHRLQLVMMDEEAKHIRELVLRECCNRSRGKRRRVLHWLGYAAMLVVMVGGGLVYYWTTRVMENTNAGQQVCVSGVKSGERVAVLQLASGSEIVLCEDSSLEVDLGEGMVFQQDSVLSVDSLGTGEKVVLADTAMNIVRVPKGGEYKLTLADGTSVWLNSGSAMRFPARFSGKQREIYLEGEAFFQVKADTAYPFIVRTGGTEIRVLGTSFNVMNYVDEARVEVALLTGKVDFRDSLMEEGLKMMPGDVVRMNKDDRKMTVTREDVALVAAWREGYFYFDNMPMEELVVKLARWYQVDFLFATEKAKRMCFTGAVKKHEPLKEVLDLIEKTGDVRFIDLGGKIKIYQK